MLTASAHEEAVVCSIDSARIKHRLTMLVNEILGKSERRVFQTRCMTANEPAKLEELAAELGVSSERIYQLEASAKRKIAVALAEEGYLFGDVTTLIKETKVRASRRSPNHQPEAVAAK
jgi:DNA-directed RNA polymerase sigma subunit (sigma70/sigma32)